MSDDAFQHFIDGCGKKFAYKERAVILETKRAREAETQLNGIADLAIKGCDAIEQELKEIKMDRDVLRKTCDRLEEENMGLKQQVQELDILLQEGRNGWKNSVDNRFKDAEKYQKVVEENSKLQQKIKELKKWKKSVTFSGIDHP